MAAHCYIIICRFMHIYTYICWIHTDAIINDERRLLLKNMYLSLYCKGFKKVNQSLCVRGSWRPNITAIYWAPLLWPSALCLSRSPGLLNRRPRGPLCCVRAFSTASCHQRVSKHHRGSRGLLRPGVAFPTTSQLHLQLSDFLSWQSYIIVPRPLNCPLNLWNGMFDRHQAEIIVMQFRGHSLLVHQSTVAQWDLHLAPILSARAHLRDLFRLMAIGMCHFRYLWNGIFARAEGQNTTSRHHNLSLYNKKN